MPMRLDGAAELGKVLAELPEELARVALKNAAMKGAIVLQDAAKANAPVGTRPHKTRAGTVLLPGFGRDAIRRWTVKTTPTRISVAVGIPSKGKWAQGWYMRLIEFGTQFFPAQPWLLPAFGSSWKEAVDVSGKELGKQIEKLAKKLAGKYGAVRKSLLKSSDIQ
jgi:HK97 gp10 family phage protein